MPYRALEIDIRVNDSLLLMPLLCSLDTPCYYVTVSQQVTLLSCVGSSKSFVVVVTPPISYY